MGFRSDIQALRGFAVLLILLFHAGIGPFTAGYLGVDIFFVISGFLITGLLKRGIEQGDFSFKEFYFRRAKRLLPAAYVTLLLTIIGSYFFLTAKDFADFRDQVLGALTFTTNITLLHQSGYFEGAAKAKPLLHMWSLAIEEQFYMIVPLALFFTPPRFWKIGAVLAVGLSLLACFLVYQRSPDAAFFYLPTRAWELGIGALGALYIGHAGLARAARLLFWPALAVLLAIPLWSASPVHPGLDAVLVCAATLVLILRGIPEGAWLKPFVKLGDYSYSLYLVHWPLFAFAANAYMEEAVPLTVRAALLALSFGLAFLLYHLVENPLHRAPVKGRRPLVTGFALGALLLTALTLLVQQTYADAKVYADIRRPNDGLSAVCRQDGGYVFKEACQTGSRPEILIWGDSHARHLVPGIVAQAGERGVLQATKNGCSPLLGLNYLYPHQTAAWSKTCVDFNQGVLEKLAATPSIKTVVLSSAFNGMNAAGVQEAGGPDDPVILTPDLIVDHMAKTVRQIRALGRQVVLVSSPPRSDFNIGSCLERQVTDKITLGPHQACRIAMTASGALPETHMTLYKRLAQEADLNVLDLAETLCAQAECKTTLNGKWLYYDGEHLSYEGSEEIFKEFNLLQHIDRKAR
jgi:peptidoglycan/LPS O-acetylase OafA/YrhL